MVSPSIPAVLLLLWAPFAMADFMQPKGSMEFGNGLAIVNPSAAASIVLAGAGQRLLVADQESNINRNGRVFVFERAGAQEWTEIQQITSQSPNTGVIFFPHVISASGDWLAAGAAHDPPVSPNTVEGSVQMYRWNAVSNRYDFTQYIQPGTNIWDSSQRDDEFGMTCVVHEEWLLAGAPWSDSGLEETDEGAAYFYQLDGGTNWVFRQRVTPPDNVAHGWFGVGVSMHGTNAFIAATRYGPPYASGRVYWYVLVDGVWTLNGHVDPDGGAVADIQLNVGAFDGEWLKLAGAASGTQWKTGRVYMFRLADGVLTQEFLSNPTDLDAYSYYGGGGMSFPVMLAGARGQDGERGICDVFSYRNGSWGFVERLAPDDLEAYDRFGQFSATDGTNVWVVASGAGNSGGDKRIKIYAYLLREHHAQRITASMLVWPPPLEGE